MIDRAVLAQELARRVSALEDDLRARADEVPEVAEVVEEQWREAREAGRTAHDLPVWRESLFTQVAVGWVLATTFVRFCEDNGLIPDPVISGPGERRRRAEEAQRMWFRDHPADGERAYVTAVLRRAAQLPGLDQVLGEHNPVWLFGPSDDAVRDLLAYWREIDPETGELRRDFRDPTWNTRFLGDLYQDLSASAREQYALLQTPEFVEEFILDRTLEPAIDEFGLDGFRMIDPACGSGHFLLGAFDRLLARWRQRAPQEGDRALAARALASVHGVDLNPYAAAIARFRLLVAALRAADVRTLAEAPNFPINVAVGDSLLHGPPPGQGTFTEIEHGADPATRHLYATEDRQTIHKMLEGGYHAVVANPPYITPKDPAANQAYRNRYSTCYRQYSLAVPFMERLFDLAVRGDDSKPAGFVGQITANSFMKREFGKPLIEKFLAHQVDLTHVIDTSGAYIPGHGTPTVILLGRNRKPQGDVRAVLGIRGEPSTPQDAAKGEVWTSITNLIDTPGAENDYI
ncbi:MAG: BREX-2 system adenine-specific DNA-methyltransferase PglX, partial [Acidimicrobiia bacterium]